jgi:hypothetical protein
MEWKTAKDSSGRYGNQKERKTVFRCKIVALAAAAKAAPVIAALEPANASVTNCLPVSAVIRLLRIDAYSKMLRVQVQTGNAHWGSRGDAAI